MKTVRNGNASVDSGSTQINVTTHTYDNRNRLASVTTHNGEPSGGMPSEQWYIYDGQNLLMVLSDASGDVELRWAGGFRSRHALCRPVQTYEQLSNYEELVRRIGAFRAQRKTLAQIAEALNAEGFRPPKRSPKFTKGILSCLLRERRARAGSVSHSAAERRHLTVDEWWLADLAAELKMPIATLHRWQRMGWLTSRKITEARGCWAVYADADELTRLRRLRQTPRGWPQAYPKELTTPKRRTA